MSDDLKERLREQAESLDASILNAIRRRRDVEFSALACNEIGLLLTKAADRIAELEAQLVRAVEVLEPFAAAAEYYQDENDLDRAAHGMGMITRRHIINARAVLQELKGADDE